MSTNTHQYFCIGIVDNGNNKNYSYNFINLLCYYYYFVFVLEGYIKLVIVEGYLK